MVIVRKVDSEIETALLLFHIAFVRKMRIAR